MGPLGYINRILMPNKAKNENRKFIYPKRKLVSRSRIYIQNRYAQYSENAEQEVGFAKQRIGSYLTNGASKSESDENLGPLGYKY